MKNLSKSFLLACAFLLTGAAANVSAQSLTFPPITIHVTRTYTGTATQTSAAGAVTTGTCTVTLDDRGQLAGLIVIDGVTTNYYGVLSRAKLGEKRTSGSGYFSSLKVVITSAGSLPVTGATPITVTGSTVVFSAPQNKVPVVVTATAAYGGLLNEDGSSLVFRAARTTETTEN